MDDIDRRPPRLYRRLALIGALILLVVAAKLFSIGFFSSSAASAYNDGQYRISEADYRKLLVANVVERWKAPNNIGVARYRQNDFVGAQRAFTDALNIAPERCDVRYNLVIAIEAQADAAAKDGPTDESRKLYQQALAVIDEGDCPIERPDASSTTTTAPDTTSDTGDSSPSSTAADGSDGKSAGEKLNEAEQRIDDKHRQGSQTPSTGSAPDSSTPQNTEPNLPDEKQEKKLEERSKNATQERRDAERNSEFPTNRSYDEPRW